MHVIRFWNNFLGTDEFVYSERSNMILISWYLPDSLVLRLIDLEQTALFSPFSHCNSDLGYLNGNFIRRFTEVEMI